jgi:hypothetical protein
MSGDYKKIWESLELDLAAHDELLDILGAFGKSRFHILASKIGTTARFFSIFHRPDLKYERSINIASAV